MPFSHILGQETAVATISVETARRRAHGRRLGAELERLAVHGLCHLFGHDHKKKAEATVMFALERRLRRLPLPAARCGQAPAPAARRARGGAYPQSR